jgi:hypothetical protein
MKNLKNKYILGIITLGILFYMLKDSFTQPGIKELKGSFTETAFYRNENNTGPVLRVYAVSVSDTLYSEMIDYGNLMPHTKYGTTIAYFFKDSKPFPTKLTGTPPHFDPAFSTNCIGVYTKNGMSKVSFSRSFN